MRIGLYSPFMGSTMGGGEKYLGVTAETLRDAFPGHSVEILSPVPVDVGRYQEMLGLDLSGISFRSANSSGYDCHCVPMFSMTFSTENSLSPE